MWPVLLVIPILLGCQSSSTSPTSTATKPPSPKSDALASVTVEAANETRVRVAVIRVFQQHGFEGREIYESAMVFEKRGSLGDDILRGSLLSQKTIERARILVVPDGPSRYRVDCYVFIVEYAGDRIMEEEHRVRRRGSYPEWLEEVRKSVAEVREPPP